MKKRTTGYGIRGWGGWLWASVFGDGGSMHWTKHRNNAMHYASARQARRVLMFCKANGTITGDDAKVVRFVKRCCERCGK